MSLESDIQELTVAVRALTHALAHNAGVKLNEEQLASTGHVTIDKAIEVAMTMGDSVKVEDPNDSPKPSTTSDTSPPSSDELRTVTYDDVKDVTIAVSKIDKAKAVAGLARFGVTTAKALSEEQWEPYVHYMNRVHNGSVDPEASHE